MPDSRLVFLDDEGAGQSINGHEVLTLEQFASTPANRRSVAVAIASSRARQKVVERCRAKGVSFFEVRAANAVEMDDVTIGEGALISPFVTFTSTSGSAIIFTPTSIPTSSMTASSAIM